MAFDGRDRNTGGILILRQVMDPRDFLSGNDVGLVSDQREFLRPASKDAFLVYVTGKRNR